MIFLQCSHRIGRRRVDEIQKLTTKKHNQRLKGMVNITSDFKKEKI